MDLLLARLAEGQGIIRSIHVTLLELERTFLVVQRSWDHAGIEEGVQIAVDLR